MPVYEYKCPNKMCSDYGKVIEVIKPIHRADDMEKCHCKRILIKLMSRTNFVLKGTGWYAK